MRTLFEPADGVPLRPKLLQLPEWSSDILEGAVLFCKPTCGPCSDL